MVTFSNISRLLIIVAGACILCAIYFPIWQIELSAPQYPEGLNLLIYSNKIGGDVEIINGLNHYIGMKTLHAEEFIEFKILPYLIGFFGIFSLVTGLLKSKRLLGVLLFCFFLFGVLSMVDFWRWEYDYGHNLNPDAAIIVPGMAYQPPLIGFKQLLNFGAYSIPDLGGWFLLMGGILLFIAFLIEFSFLKKYIHPKPIVSGLILISMYSCNPAGPEPVIINKDNCAFCKMTVSDSRYSSELITKKGRIYKFDDLNCMFNYANNINKAEIGSLFVSNFTGKNELIPAETAYYIKGGKIKSPMDGNIAAFKEKKEAEEYKVEMLAEETYWDKIFSR